MMGGAEKNMTECGPNPITSRIPNFTSQIHVHLYSLGGGGGGGGGRGECGLHIRSVNM